MQPMSRLFDKAGALGTVVSALGCACCYPALGSLAAALGMGFLAQYEGLFITTLLPIFAFMALGANLISYFTHYQWQRTLIGMTGPLLVIVARYPLWGYLWAADVLYTGLAIMMVVAVWDLVSPAQKVCSVRSTG